MPLFIVATPIGNLQDITLRAIKVLKEADAILCENTKETAFLLEKHGISGKKLIPFTDHTEERVFSPFLKEALVKNIALVSDAGTPLISDPGYLLLQKAHALGVKVEPIPGACSIISALSACPLPVNKFAFLGFFSKESIIIAKKLLEEEISVAFFLPGRDISKVLNTLLSSIPEHEISISRELTKIFEDIKTCLIPEMISYYSAEEKLKGEAVLIISGKKVLKEKPRVEELLAGIFHKKPFLLKIGIKYLSEVMKTYEKDFKNISKKEIYAALIKLKA